MLLNILFSGLLQLTSTPLSGIKMENSFALPFDDPTVSYNVSEKDLVVNTIIHYFSGTTAASTTTF